MYPKKAKRPIEPVPLYRHMPDRPLVILDSPGRPIAEWQYRQGHSKPGAPPGSWGRACGRRLCASAATAGQVAARLGLILRRLVGQQREEGVHEGDAQV